MAKADVQCMSEGQQGGLLWSVKFKFSHVKTFRLPQYVQILPSFLFLIANLSIESTDD